MCRNKLSLKTECPFLVRLKVQGPNKCVAISHNLYHNHGLQREDSGLVVTVKRSQLTQGELDEIVAMNAARAAGADLAGATVYSTLEPCSHTGRTGPCADALMEAGVSRVVVGIVDPDTKVSGNGIARLSSAGINVETGVLADEVRTQLATYIHHRTTGRPFVMLKMATTLDAKTSVNRGDRWITGETARTRVHRLRAESDAIVVGAGTVAEAFGQRCLTM